MSKDEENNSIENKIKTIKGILKIVSLSEEEKAEVLKLEGEAECHVMMGLCQGINIGIREAVRKKWVYACLTDNTMEWPKCPYIKIYAGDAIIGEQVVDPAMAEELKKQGNIFAGEIVFYRDKFDLLRERKDDMRVHILPLEMPDILGKGAVVGSPSPPGDSFLKQKMMGDLQDSRLGTIVIGID
ncbi:MAG: hypothetical protein LUP94_01185 [Candidatus Methanomethylicus sp.]|nr:hypothetical protein [Candidatus Methanomethylicus sp.]